MNAVDILTLLEIDCDRGPYGEMRAAELIPRIQRALERGFDDSEIEGGTYIWYRRSGYRKETLNRLMKICEISGALGRITWS